MNALFDWRDSTPDASALEDRSLFAVGAAVAPMPVSIVVFALVGGLTGTGPSEFALPTTFLVYGLANLAVVVGLAVYQVTTTVTLAFGYEMSGLSYSLSDPATLAIVVAGPVLLGPWAEELLYRGLMLGGLLARGWSPVVAAATIIAVFGVIHIPLFGVAGGVFVTVWSVLPTALRLRYDDLTGPGLLHVANNAFAYLVAVALAS